MEYWASKAGLQPIAVCLRQGYSQDEILDRIFAVYDQERVDLARANAESRKAAAAMLSRSGSGRRIV